MPVRFTLVRYRADSLRDECRNIGLVAWDDAGFAHRLIDGLPAELAEYARVQVARLREDLDAHQGGARIDQETIRHILTRFDGPYAAVFFRHETGSSIRDGAIGAILAELWGWHFDAHPGDSPYGRWVWHQGPPEFAGVFVTPA